MRLFVAVNLPASEQARLSNVLDSLRASDLPVRWIDSSSLHVTLKFLGEVNDRLITDVASALKHAVRDIGPFEIALGHFGMFPARGRPRVIWIGVDPPPVFGRLQSQVERALGPLGFPAEDRAFSPHITVGRARPEQPRLERADVDRITRSIGYNAKISIYSVELMRSHPGSRYEVLERVPLYGSE